MLRECEPPRHRRRKIFLHLPPPTKTVRAESLSLLPAGRQEDAEDAFTRTRGRPPRAPTGPEGGEKGKKPDACRANGAYVVTERPRGGRGRGRRGAGRTAINNRVRSRKRRLATLTCDAVARSCTSRACRRNERPSEPPANLRGRDPLGIRRVPDFADPSPKPLPRNSFSFFFPSHCLFLAPPRREIWAPDEERHAVDPRESG